MQPVGLWLRRLFTRGFMQDDVNRLAGIRYNPATLVAADRLMAEFFAWAAGLPQVAREPNPMRLSGAATAVDCPIRLTSIPAPCEDPA